MEFFQKENVLEATNTPNQDQLTPHYESKENETKDYL